MNLYKSLIFLFQIEFDAVDSQMDSQDFMEDRGNSKRKKASIVSKAIMV